MPQPIRVLLVEDSPVALAVLTRILKASPDIEIVGTARTGQEALDLLPEARPQVICTDLHMPQMDGLELTRRVMSTSPKPILVISASVQEDDSQNIFQLLEAGAVDIFPKPVGGLAVSDPKIAQALIDKIKVLSGVTVFTQHRGRSPSANPGNPAAVVPLPLPPLPADVNPRPATGGVLVIGASTGGPQALYTILSQLPPKFPLPIVCVQHISEGFLQGLINWLGHGCALPVTIARSGDLPRSGHVYFPPERQHLLFDGAGRFVTRSGAPVSGHCPSVTVTFESVAHTFRRSAIGVLLTGMGRDGADGLLAIAQAGGMTIAQDEASSVIFGMPREAIALGAAQHILPLNDIAGYVIQRCMTGRSRL